MIKAFNWYYEIIWLISIFNFGHLITRAYVIRFTLVAEKLWNLCDKIKKIREIQYRQK